MNNDSLSTVTLPTDVTDVTDVTDAATFLLANAEATGQRAVTYLNGSPLVALPTGPLGSDSVSDIVSAYHEVRPDFV